MTKFYLLAAAVISIAAPVVAKDAKPADTAQTETAQPITTAAAPRAAAPDRKYCVIETLTGSRIPQKTCQTRAEWLRDGFDPLEK